MTVDERGNGLSDKNSDDEEATWDLTDPDQLIAAMLEAGVVLVPPESARGVRPTGPPDRPSEPSEDEDEPAEPSGTEDPDAS